MAIACGTGFTLVVSEVGEVWGFGRNHLGQLGTGLARDEPTPALVGGSAVFGEPVAMVAAHGQRAACVTESGAVFAWGVSEFGQVGTHAPEPLLRPVRMNFAALAGGYPAAMLSCGGGHMLVLTRRGDVWACGDGSWGKLGLSEVVWGKYNPTLMRCVVVSESAIHGRAIVTMVAAGGDHSVALASDGAVYTWGRATAGQLGDWAYSDVNFRTCTPLPTLVCRRASLARAVPFCGAKPVMISAGLSHTAAVTDAGRVFVWGAGLQGQLGLGARENVYLPTAVGAVGGFPASAVVSVAGGEHHSLFLCAKGVLWACGYHGPFSYGKFLRAAESCVNSAVPVRVDAGAFGGAGIVSAAGGPCQCVAVDTHGGLYSWGTAVYADTGHPGALGRAFVDNVFIDRPLRLVLPGDARAGGYHILLVLALAMGTHARLGDDCVYQSFPSDALREIVVVYRRSRRVLPAHVSEGVARLLGDVPTH